MFSVSVCRIACVVAMLCLSATALYRPVIAHEYQAGSITLVHPWAPPPLPMVPVAAGYVTLKNTGDKADTLIAVSTAIASTTDLHETVIADGVTRMESRPAVTIPPGGEVVFKPGGLHIMFMGLQQSLVIGEQFAVEFIFAKGGSVSVQMNIEPLESTMY